MVALLLKKRTLSATDLHRPDTRLTFRAFVSPPTNKVQTLP